MKVAKLVRVSFVTRVIVDANLSDDEVVNIAQNNIIHKATTEIHENVDDVEIDTECPYEEN